MPRFSLRQLIALVAVMAVCGGVYVGLNRSPLIKLYGSSHNLDVVRSPTRVDAYRLGEPPGGLPLTDYVSPLEYPVAAGPVTVPAKVAKTVSAALTSKDSYGWDYDKACGYPVYGVKLAFYQNDDRVDVYFCFLCNVLAVVREDEKVDGEDFDDARNVIVKAMKEIFPTDEVLQQLKETK